MIMKKTPITVSVIGCGYWGSILLQELQHNPSLFHVVACVDPSADIQNRIHRLYPDIPTFKKTTDMYASVSCDAVIIATPTTTHLGLVAEALQQKKHVWVEKPITLHSHDIDELLALRKKVHRAVFVDHTYRYDEGIQKLSAIVHKKDVGPLYEIRSTRTSDGIFRPGESVAWDILVHDLTIGSVIFDDFPIAISASGSSFTKNLPMDTMMVHALYTKNRHMYVTLSWQAAYKTRLIEVIGPHTMVSYEEKNMMRDMHIYTKEDDTWKQTNIYRMQLVHQSLHHALIHFAESIRKNIQPLTGLSEGKEVIRILEAADQSVKQHGMLIQLPLSN
jgi:predicted dehydrogenase